MYLINKSKKMAYCLRLGGGVVTLPSSGSLEITKEDLQKVRPMVQNKRDLEIVDELPIIPEEAEAEAAEKKKVEGVLSAPTIGPVNGEGLPTPDLTAETVTPGGSDESPASPSPPASAGPQGRFGKGSRAEH